MEINFQSIFYTINAPWIALMNQIAELHFSPKQTNKNLRYISVKCHQLFLWERQGVAYWLHVFLFVNVQRFFFEEMVPLDYYFCWYSMMQKLPFPCLSPNFMCEAQILRLLMDGFSLPAFRVVNRDFSQCITLYERLYREKGQSQLYV